MSKLDQFIENMLLKSWSKLMKVRRRERDLNSRATRTRDFQSRAIPGYAISAANRLTSISRLTETVGKGYFLIRIDYIAMVGRTTTPPWLSGIAPHW